jgi:hypothetical protein
MESMQALIFFSSFLAGMIIEIFLFAVAGRSFMCKEITNSCPALLVIDNKPAYGISRINAKDYNDCHIAAQRYAVINNEVIKN